MAKTTITRSCGHQETVNICGPYAGRERQAEYEATKSCKACWQAEQDAKRQAANAEAATAAQTAGRPELQGTEKQVAWATTIRETLTAGLEQGRSAVDANPKASVEYKAIIGAVIDRIEAEASAAWWIEHRETHPLSIIKAATTDEERAGLLAAMKA